MNVRHEDILHAVTMPITIKTLCVATLHWRCCASSSTSAISLHVAHVDSFAALRSNASHFGYNTTWAVAGEGCFFSNAFASEEIDEKNVMA